MSGRQPEHHGDQGGADDADGQDRGATRQGCAEHREPGDRIGRERVGKEREVEETTGQDPCDR